MAQASRRRMQILDFILQFSEERGYTPTIRDIMRGCSINSVASVQHHLSMLEKEGAIHRDPNVVRSIQIAERDIVEVPLMGTIAAGEPIPVFGSDSWAGVPEEVLRLTTDLVGNDSDIYALKVKGNSMVDALVADGDIVIMKRVESAEEGQMVAVWLKDEQETTLKRIYREPGRIRLQPANAAMAPIYVNPGNVEVQGRVIRVIRML